LTLEYLKGMVQGRPGRAETGKENKKRAVNPARRGGQREFESRKRRREEKKVERRGARLFHGYIVR